MTSGQGVASLRREGSWVAVSAPYDPRFVERLKSELPRHARKWDPEAKVWRVREDFTKSLLEIAHAHFRRVVWTNATAADTRSAASPYEALLRAAPHDVLQDVCRRVVAACHPDKGGSHDAFIDAKAAWDAIRKDQGF